MLTTIVMKESETCINHEASGITRIDMHMRMARPGLDLIIRHAWTVSIVQSSGQGQT